MRDFFLLIYEFQLSKIARICSEWRNLSAKDRIFSVIVKPKPTNGALVDTVHIYTFENFWNIENIENIDRNGNYLVRNLFFFFVSNFFLKLYFLSAQVIFTFFDSSSSLKNPSSILRNYITYLYVRITQLYKKFQNNLCVLNFIKQSLFSNAFHIGSIRIGNSQLANDCLPNVTKTLAYCPVYRLLLCPSNKRFDSFCSDSYFEAFLEDLKIEKKFDKIPPVVGWERNPSFSNRIVPFVVLKPNLFK